MRQLVPNAQVIQAGRARWRVPSGLKPSRTRCGGTFTDRLVGRVAKGRPKRLGKLTGSAAAHAEHLAGLHPHEAFDSVPKDGA